MKQNKKGFTLIELLAVIVILAIIALIAVPVIMNILDKANRSAFKDTAYGIISAGELYFSEQQLELNGMLEDKEFTLPSQINAENGLQLKGNVSDITGTVNVTTEGKVAMAISNGRYCITKGYDDTDITVIEDTEKCYIPGTLAALSTTSDAFDIDTVLSCATDGTKCNPGDAFAIQVNKEDTYKFYVLNDAENKITLMMSENLGNKVAWVNKTDYNDDKNYGSNGNTNKGPITAINYLDGLTDEEWSNVPKREYKYSGLAKDEKTRTYEDIIKTMRARMVTYEEVDNINKANSGTFPDWLYSNLSSSVSSSNISLHMGYWTSTAYDSDVAYNVRNFGSFSSAFVNVGAFYGVRPVIELYK